MKVSSLIPIEVIAKMSLNVVFSLVASLLGKNFPYISMNSAGFSFPLQQARELTIKKIAMKKQQPQLISSRYSLRRPEHWILINLSGFKSKENANYQHLALCVCLMMDLAGRRKALGWCVRVELVSSVFTPVLLCGWYYQSFPCLQNGKYKEDLSWDCIHRETWGMGHRADYNLILSHSRLWSQLSTQLQRKREGVRMGGYGRSLLLTFVSFCLEQLIGTGRVRGRGREGMEAPDFMS
jgi:hypothetical protein